MVAIPKPASTVVLVDEQYNVYLTQRPKTMKFLGGFYVFPGGGMDEADRLVGNELLTGEIQDDSLHKGHYITAARELFEEVGVLLGDRKDSTTFHLTESEKETYRKQILDGDITFGQLLKREHMTLSFESLQYFGHLVTPERFPIRFDTRFFLAKLPKGQSPVPNNGEVEEAFWISAEEGLQQYENKQLLLAPPTIVVLESIINFKNGEKLAINNERVQQLEKTFLK